MRRPIRRPTRDPDEIPELTEPQRNFLVAYRRLEVALKRAPTYDELADEVGGYSERSRRSGPQKMTELLRSRGYIAPFQLVGGEVTQLGLEALKRYKNRK